MTTPRLFHLFGHSGIHGECYGSPGLYKVLPPGEIGISDGKAYFRIMGSCRKWPDVIDTRDGVLLVSDSAMQALAGSGLRGMAFYEAELGDFHSDSMARKPHPPYHWVKPLGRIDVDLSRLKECSSKSDTRTIPVSSSWSGEDLTRIANIVSGAICCTRAFLEVVRTFKWKNLAAVPMDLDPNLTSEYSNHSFSIDLFGKEWPPQWYPPGVTGDPANLERSESE